MRGENNWLNMISDGRQEAISRTKYVLPDGSIKTKTEITPSASGAKAGAAAGAVVGSVIPGVGTAIGAGVGAVVGFIFGPAD